MNRYIIKNCPNYFKAHSGNYCDLDASCCQDCTDCVLKCIKSKLDYLKCYINNDDSANLSKMNEIIDGTLKLLNIQEVE